MGGATRTASRMSTTAPGGLTWTSCRTPASEAARSGYPRVAPIPARQAKALLAKVRPRDAAGKARRRVAAELIADQERIYARKGAVPSLRRVR
jgi:hypothetical protein